MNRRHFFFYGTLMDPLIRRAVLGHSIDRSEIHRAALRGFRRVFRCGATYPVLVGDADGEVEGALVCGLSPRDVARLVAYESADYRLVEQTVQMAEGHPTQASVFLPQTEAIASAIPWEYEDWRRRFRARFLKRVNDYGAAEAADQGAHAAAMTARG